MLIVNLMVVLLAIQVSAGEIEDFESELSNIVGLQDLKVQLNRWTKGMLLDQKRREMGINLSPRRPPHLAFFGNPGTGKTTVARMLGKYLHSIKVLSTSKVVEIQRTDLVAEYVGQTGPKTRQKIKEAMGGILFVDEAYRLLPAATGNDYGAEALEEIMSVMEENNLVVIFAGYTGLMELLFSVNSGLRRRVTHIFYFDDFNCDELAEMAILKVNRSDKNSTFYGFKLHSSCTIDAISKLIEANSNESLRREMNGGLVDNMLSRAREHLDMRLSVDAGEDEMVTITLNDIEAGLKLTVVNVDEPADVHESPEQFDMGKPQDLSNTVQRNAVAWTQQMQSAHMHQRETTGTSDESVNNAHDDQDNTLNIMLMKLKDYAPIVAVLGFAAAPLLGYQFKFSHATAVFIWALISSDINQITPFINDAQRLGGWITEEFWKLSEMLKENIL